VSVPYWNWYVVSSCEGCPLLPGFTVPATVALLAVIEEAAPVLAVGGFGSVRNVVSPCALSPSTLPEALVATAW
jgi:hypothetical protein